MGIEIERKFLVKKDLWQQTDKEHGNQYQQGYIPTTPGKTIRVRTTDNEGFITIKGPTQGITRSEYEYSIPKSDAVELIQKFCSTTVSKIRYKIDFKGKTWEVDVFDGENHGLILAEIELNSEAETFEIPEWIDREVTGDVRYYNSRLSVNPYLSWDENKNL